MTNFKGDETNKQTKNDFLNRWIQKMSYFQIHQFSIFNFEKILDLAMKISPIKGHFIAKRPQIHF